MLSWASACALAPKLCSTPKLFLVSLPKLDDSASGAPGWSVARMSFLPRIWRTIEAQFENLRILGGNETSWKPLEFRPQTCVSGTCQLFHRFAGRQQHAWNLAFKMKHKTNLYMLYVSCSQFIQAYSIVSVLNIHLMTMSTHFWPRIFPSGSTTAYFFGLLHSTWGHSWIFTQGKYWFLFSSKIPLRFHTF